MEKEQFLTINELAETFGISRRTVYRMIDQGIPHIKVSKNTKFIYSEVIEWFKNKNN